MIHVGFVVMPSQIPKPNESLADLFPRLVSEWHPTKNNGLKPTDVTSNSHKNVWWRCSKGHEWQTTVKNRSHGIGCPYCSNKRVLQGENDLATINPSLASEWHPTKNGDLEPTDVTKSSHKNIWWKCANGHEWQATVNTRDRGHGCPYCSNQKVLVGKNDLATVNPKLASEWHPTKNGNLMPTDVMAGSQKRVWWRCSNNHEWQTTVYSRSDGTGCPYCAGRLALQSYNDLSTLNPRLTSEWHPTKNKNLKPSDVTVYSNRKVWWRCSKGHEWQAKILSRSYGTGCPFCSASGTSYPEQFLYWSLKQIFPRTKNREKLFNGIEYDIYVPELSLAIEYSGAYWHEGKRDKSLYKEKLASENGVSFIEVFEESNAVYCRDIATKGVSDKDLLVILDYILSLYQNSMVSIDIQFSHEQATKYSKGNVEHEKSLAFQFPSLASEWHPTKNGDLKPTEVTVSSGKRVWWRCSKSHEWQATVNNRTLGYGCPYCSNKKVQQGENDLATINPSLASEWHPTKNGDLKPTDVTIGSSKKVWWKCSKGHEWQALISNRSKGSGCPTCWNLSFPQRISIPKPCKALACLNPTLASEWHPTKNGDLTPTDITVGSSKRVWWMCSKGHEWQATVNDRNNGSGCPICGRINRAKKLSMPKEGESLAYRNPTLASEWHPTKNADLMPTEVTVSSGKKVWWRCAKGHEWQATIHNRSKGHGCPYCANKKGIQGENDLATINPTLAAEWHPTKNGDLKPTDVTIGSGKKVWWRCSKGHEWQTTISNRSRLGHGCPYCSNKKVQQGENDLATINPSLASE